MSTLSAVLWDMDGTLVDTEILWDKAIYGAMEEIGSPPVSYTHLTLPTIYSV